MSAPISVLVVDDDLFVRETLTDYLRDADDLTLAGMSIEDVRSGKVVRRYAPTDKPAALERDIEALL